jgi:RNase H-like domain found in reverse transcriptase
MISSEGIHMDHAKPAIIEVDASDFAYRGVLSQYDDDGVLHPCAFVSKKFNPAELNYEIYDKEMLAIVKCMYGHWRHYLEGSGQQVQVFTDHKNIFWFTETKVYNRRQAHWAEKLSRFDFTITFRPVVRQGKPDALSRRPDHRSPKGGIHSATNTSSRFSSLNKLTILKVTLTLFQQWK